MQNKVWWRFFWHRGLLCYFVLIIMFLCSFLRVAVITKTDYTNVLQSHGKLKIEIAKLRGTIYDCNMVPLTNKKTKIIAVVSPTENGKKAISTVLSGNELNDLLKRLENGKPVAVEVPQKIETNDIVCTTVYYDDSPVLAPHTIGYTNTENKGVTGLEAAYDNVLYCNESVYISYSCDGVGNILKGIKPEIVNKTSMALNGIVTTIDYNIQTIIEETSNDLTCGAIVVADVENLKIRGIVSRPNFDNLNISEYLNNEYSPLFNRALNCYAVGSAFKPCVAAAAIENGLLNTNYNCIGNLKIADRTFNCHEKLGHGQMNLEYALANSCNTYFFNLAFKTGGNFVYRMANSLNFGNKIKLCEGIYTAKGNIPTTDKLTNLASLANFSIGQGEFTASPISMLTLYSSIANGGKYYMPSLIEGTYQNGNLIKYDIGYPTRVMNESTANTLKEYLKTVISEGTGKLAEPQTVSAAGKTATAQTGKFVGGKEILSSWFCGFFPAENPKYVAIIFCENNSLQTKTCAEIFAKTADMIMENES